MQRANLRHTSAGAYLNFLGFPEIGVISAIQFNFFLYSRIVWDIFPPVCDDWNDHKLIRLVLFNEKETKKVISTWGRKQQNCLTLTNELAIGGRPHLTVNKFGSTAKAAKEKLKNGLRVALQLLTENSEAQENVRNKDSSVMINRGRIVCLTTFEDDDVVSFIEDFAVILKKELSDMNSTAAGSSTLSSIAQLEVNVVCCFGFMRPKQQMPEELIRQVSHSVNLVVNTVPAGMELSRLAFYIIPIRGQLGFFLLLFPFTLLIFFKVGNTIKWKYK